MLVGGAQDQRTALPHLLVQEPDGVALRVVRAKRVRADQLGQPGAEMRLGAAHRARISCSTTGTPARASCHAASLPASPPPMMCTGFMPNQLFSIMSLRNVLELRSRSPTYERLSLTSGEFTDAATGSAARE
jgi:hypothetical protein